VTQLSTEIIFTEQKLLMFLSGIFRSQHRKD